MAVFNVKKVIDDKIKPHYNFDFEMKNEQISVIESVLEKKSYGRCFSNGVWQRYMLFVTTFDSGSTAAWIKAYLLGNISPEESYVGSV